MIAKKSLKMKKAVGILMELSEDERTRMLEEKKEIARRDRASLMKDAQRKGIEIGKAEGIEIGKIEGKTEGKTEGEREKAIAIAKKLYEMGMDIDTIAKATGLTVEEVKALVQATSSQSPPATQ